MLREKLESLTKESSLNDYQEYVRMMIQERGFQEETPRDLLLLLTEEVGELAKAIRKSTNMKMDVEEITSHGVEEEIADVFNYILSLCCTLNMDLHKCYYEKEKKNLERTWR